jgi:hypothetical protein
VISASQISGFPFPELRSTIPPQSRGRAPHRHLSSPLTGRALFPSRQTGPLAGGAALPRSVCLALVIFGLAFAPRLQGQAPDFTIIVLPDTQYYSETYPQILNSQTQWIVNNAAALDIQLVLGAGDIVNAGSTPAEWNNADAAYKLLDGAHIPYFAAIGNHDYESSNPAARLATNFNA